MKTLFTILFVFSYLLPSSASELIFKKVVDEIDQLVKKSLDTKHIPGLVVLWGQTGVGVLHEKAYGYKQIKPKKVDADVNVIYDLASISKVYTALAIAVLVDQEKMTFSDSVGKYIPEFNTEEKKEITVAHLLRHKGGYPSVNYMSDYDPEVFTVEQMWENIFNLKLVTTPGGRSIYSDLGYMVLSRVVERVSGEIFEEFVTRNIFRPMGLTSTFFRPDDSILGRVAPTTDDVPVGVVHDPRCRAIGGAAGNAGIFSTAGDMQKLAEFFIARGKVGDNQVISQNIIEKMITLESGETRGLGLSIIDGYSTSLRGSYIPRGESYGHSGYTGSSFWVDDRNDFYIIILTNRVHSGDTLASKGEVVQLRRDLANIIGSYYYPKFQL